MVLGNGSVNNSFWGNEQARRSMNVNRSKDLLICILVAVFLVTAVASCDRYTKHDVLTFFFTGVPSPEEEEKAAAEKAKEQQAAAKKQEPILKPVRFSHPLWVAGRCDQCHQSTANFSVPGVKKKNAHSFPERNGASRTAGGSPPGAVHKVP